MTLLAIAGQRPRLRRPLQNVLDHWSRGLPGNVGSLTAWTGITQDQSDVNDAVTPVVRDVLLTPVDAQIQQIYTSRTLTDSDVRTVPEVVASLAECQAQVGAFLSAWDWHWLAAWLEPGRPGAVAALLGRLANFAFPMTRVNFRFTYHCNISCRHCYNRSGPARRQQHLPLAVMLNVIDEMEAVGIRSVNLTGGEPMLYIDTVCRLIERARARNVPQVSIYTNGFWAKSGLRADETLSRLAAAGFMGSPQDYLKVSAGVFHQEFLPFSTVTTLVAAFARRFGRPVVIDFETLPGALQDADMAQQQLHEAGLADAAIVNVRTVAPIGRGRDLVTPSGTAPDRPCEVINQLSFDPDGSVRPCCGLNDQNQGILQGKATVDSLRVLAKRMQNDPVLHHLARKPLKDLPALLEVDGPAQFGGACDICQRTVGCSPDKARLQVALRGSQPWYPFWFQPAATGPGIEVVPAAI